MMRYPHQVGATRYKPAFAVGVIGVILLAACSKVEVVPYDQSKYEDGIRFYRPKPYLLVSQLLDDKGAPKGSGIQVIYLPDYQSEFVLRERVFFGTVSMKPTLENGWNLTGLDTASDPKLAETITALVGAAKLGVAGADVLPGAGVVRTTLPPGIYPLIFDPKSGVLSGLGPRVNLT